MQVTKGREAQVSRMMVRLKRTGTKLRGNAENRAGLMKLIWSNTGGKQHQEQGGDKEAEALKVWRETQAWEGAQEHKNTGGKKNKRQKIQNTNTMTDK